jgi:hypothetical protein
MEHFWVLSLIVGVVAYVTAKNAPLQSDRPPVAQSAYLEPNPPDDGVIHAAHARLWEDPLMVAYRELKMPRTLQYPEQRCTFKPCQLLAILDDIPFAETPVQKSLREFREQVKKQNHSSLMIMPVLVPGEPYAEYREERLRTQYALLTALGRSGYELALPTRMSYVKVPIQTYLDVIGNELARADLTVPIKLFVCSETTPPKPAILVCWINESQLGDRPLSAISQILDGLFPRPIQKDLRLAIIGPTSSDGLMKILKEQPTNHHRFGNGRFYESSFERAGPTIYSPRATISMNPEIDRLPLSKLKCGLKLVRTIGDDDQLVKALLNELILRNDWPSVRGGGEVNQHVVLVYERDTLYGRKLCESLRKKILPESNLHVFTYIRGIDGMLPDDPAAEKSVPKSAVRNESGDAPQEHLPAGREQSDYLRRLAEQIEQLQRAGSKVTAIGVVGTDVYDKLLVLRALKGSFSQTTFFTTGLEALYGHPKEYQFTRNLVVASHFGLELNHALQGDAPAFRDSNQTATFFSVLMATGSLKSLGVSPGDDPWGVAQPKPPSETFLSPLMFEVGRNGPARLRADADIHDVRRELTSAVQPLESIPSRGVTGAAIGLLLLAIVALVICFAFYKPEIFTVFQFFWYARKVLSPAAWRSPKESRLLQAAAAAIILLSLVLLVGSAVYANGAIGQEHFAFGDGISTWPSTFIRYGELLFCSFALVYNCRKLNANIQSLRDDFFKDIRPSATPKMDRFQRLLWGEWPLADIMGSTVDKNSVDVVFRRYESIESCWRRAIRIAFPVVLYLVFAFLLFAASGEWPSSPFRGTISNVAGSLVLILSVIAMVALLFMVLDATHFCRRFVRRLSDAVGDLPPQGKSQVDESQRVDPILQEDLKELQIVRVIVARTRVVGRLIYLPCIALLLMFLSRYPTLGNWNYPWPLLVIYALIVLGTTYASAMIHRDAEQARADILKRLRERLVGAASVDVRREAKLRLLIRQIEQEHGGAFAPLSSSPIFNAWAVPVSGISVVALLERFGGNWF